MISATKKRKTRDVKADDEAVCARRGVNGVSMRAADVSAAARPKNKRTAGVCSAGAEKVVAGRAKTKARACTAATEDRAASVGGEKSSDAHSGTAPRKTKRRSGDISRHIERQLATSAKPKRGRGELLADTERRCAASEQTNGHATFALTPNHGMRDLAGGGENAAGSVGPYASACLELQELQRQAVSAMKSRVMISNRAVSGIALAMGYQANMTEEDRKKHWDKAAELFKIMRKGGEIPAEYQHIASLMQMLTATVSLAIDGFETFEEGLDKAMVAIVKSLPIAAWIVEPEQRGIAELSVARIIGEAGNLSNYSGPYKLFKRLGLAPYNGKMPSTWRGSKPGLSAEEWTNLGYSPRRRSVVWNIGECIVKANQSGPYRKRYDDAKADFKAKHEGCKDGHANNHAKLVASKEFVQQLWKQWNKA